MCKFCDDIKWREYYVDMRNTDACDNLCEIMSSKLENIDGELYNLGVDCGDCDGCAKSGFKLFTYDNRIGFSYNQKIKQLHIGRNSEMFDVNFCPWCGKRINQNKLVEFEDQYFIKSK